jgi:hypothetical protein
VALVINTALGLALVAAVIAVLIARWRRASPAERRVLGPVFVFGELALVLFGAGVGAQDNALFVAAFVPMALVPYAFLAGLARTAVAGSHGVRELVTRLGETADPVAVRQAFANALGDPTVSLAYRLPERDQRSTAPRSASASARFEARAVLAAAVIPGPGWVGLPPRGATVRVRPTGIGTAGAPLE